MFCSQPGRPLWQAQAAPFLLINCWVWEWALSPRGDLLHVGETLLFSAEATSAWAVLLTPVMTKMVAGPGARPPVPGWEVALSPLTQLPCLFCSDDVIPGAPERWE